jgi:hypothetical protein
MYPEHLSVNPGFDDDAYIRFDEPLADPRGVERSLVGSPADLYRVAPGRRHIRIRPVDGWRPGTVYYFRISPGLSDLLRNRTATVVELLFSTGSSLPDTRADGHLYDRLRVQTVRDGRVLFLGADSVPYTAVSDTGGVFSLPALPPGGYWVYGFMDRNRNLQLDREFEPHDSARMELPEPLSKAEVELWMTEPDSTPPLLLAARAEDSLSLRLEFDEPLEPEHPLDSARVSVHSEATDEAWPVVSFEVERPERTRDGRGREPADTAAVPGEGQEAVGDGEAELADSAAAVRQLPLDRVALEVVADSLADAVDQEPPGGRAAAEDLPLRPYPSPFVIVKLERGLESGSYRVSALGLANLRGLVGGGDTTFVYEPPPDSLIVPAPDSAAAPPDTAAAPEGVPRLPAPDSAEAMVPDTSAEGG